MDTVTENLVVLMKCGLAAGMFVAVLALPASVSQAEEHDEMNREETELRMEAQYLNMSVGVLDWCKEQAGTFYLPHRRMPICLTGGMAYVGFLGRTATMFKGGPREEAWWWERRSRWSLFMERPHLFDFDLNFDEIQTLREAEFGIAWYVSDFDLYALGDSEAGKNLKLIIECPPTIVFDNPAGVPVVLIGSGTAVCEENL